VGVEYGWNMRILVNQGSKEVVFTKPVVPTGMVETQAAAKEKEVVSPVNSVQMAEYLQSRARHLPQGHS
jgi:hypothetical protein